MNSNKIKQLLASKHSQDVFIDECPMGQGDGYLDGWAMAKKWQHPLITGYEIKVSRGDFIGDNKFPKYLDVCNQFYFVCPWGMIKESEVPENCGLMYVAKTGNRIIKKVKAPYRQTNTDKLNRLFKAILMNRVEIVDSTFNIRQPQISKLKMVEEFINQKEENRYYGKGISKKLSKLYKEKISSVERENDTLKRENTKLESVKEVCGEMGISIKSLGGYRVKEQIKSKIYSLSAAGVARNLMNAVGQSIDKLKMAENVAQNARDTITHAMEKLDNLEETEKETK